MNNEKLNQKFAEFTDGMIELRKSQAQTDAQIAKTDIQMAKAGRQMAKTEAEIEKLSVLVRNYIGNDAQTVEEYFYQTLKNTMVLGGIQYDEIGRNLSVTDNSPEFDIVLFNGNSLAIIEIKKKAHPDEIPRMAERKVADFKKWYPNYAHYQFYFGIATLVTNEALIQTSKAAQIYLLTQQGENLACLNDDVRTW